MILASLTLTLTIGCAPWSIASESCAVLEERSSETIGKLTLLVSVVLARPLIAQVCRMSRVASSFEMTPLDPAVTLLRFALSPFKC